MSVASLSSELKGVQPGTTVIDQGSGQAVSNCFCLSPPFVLWGLDGAGGEGAVPSSQVLVGTFGGQEWKGTPLEN